MDKLIKYRKKFVQFCFENGYDINKIRSSKAVTVYEPTPAEAWRCGTPFIIEVKDDTDIIHHKPITDGRDWISHEAVMYGPKHQLL